MNKKLILGLCILILVILVSGCNKQDSSISKLDSQIMIYDYSKNHTFKDCVYYCDSLEFYNFLGNATWRSTHCFDLCQRC